MTPASFNFQLRWAQIVGQFEVEVQLMVYQAIIAYVSGAELPPMDSTSRMAFEFIRLDLDSDKDRESDVIEKRRAAGRRSAQVKKDKASATNAAQAAEEVHVEIIPDEEVTEVQTAPKKSSNRFIKPTLEQISTFIEHKGYTVDAEAFFNYYESNGWRVGGVAMKNWQSAIFNWHKRQISETRSKSKSYYGTDNTNRSVAAEDAKARRDREFAEHIRRQLDGEDTEQDVWEGL